jgi:hypothetical protein
MKSQTREATNATKRAIVIKAKKANEEFLLEMPQVERAPKAEPPRRSKAQPAVINAGTM